MRDKMIEYVVYALVFILEWLPIAVFLIYAKSSIMSAIVYASVTYFLIDHFSELSERDVEFLQELTKEDKDI